MDTLRWILLAVGVAVVVGIYLWETGRRRLRQREEEELDDVERELLEGLSARRDDDPFAGLGNLRGEPLKLDAEDVRGLGPMVPDEDEPELRVEPEAARSGQGKRAEGRPAEGRPVEGRPVEARPAEAGSRLYAVDGRKGHPGEELIIVLNVMAEPGRPFPGTEVRSALESVDMRYGDMQVFHHHGVGDMRTEQPVFSVANLLKPGTFDVASLEGFATPGLVMFMRLPGPLDPRVAFELMLNTGQRLAESLHGELRDETRSVLSAQTIAHVRERIAEFNRRQLLAAS
ncbi:MAG: cell division protein ZipA [Gammaproteobacteria bacterium]|nr:cell division protein ZipA [Gammaproteobacteria bacterium]